MAATTWHSVVTHLSANHGMATRRQIAELGLPARTLRRRVSEGLLVPVNPRVLALPGLPLDLRARTRAAVLAHPAAIPTGPAAAAFLGSGPWDRTDLGTVPWLVMPDGRGLPHGRRITHPGVRMIRVSGLGISRPADAVVDLIRFWPHDVALGVAHRGLVKGTITLEHLVEAHARLARLAGARRLRAVLGDLRDGTVSEGERRLAILLREARITGWRTNHSVRAAGRRYVLDVAFPEERVAVEVDGRAYHSDARAFQYDRTRQNDLVRAGWTVLRFTWADITDRPEHVLEVITSSRDRCAPRDRGPR